MDSVQSYLDKFGKNFLVASVIPALAFLTALFVVLHNLLPNSTFDFIGDDFNLINTKGLLLIILTIILGFSLTSLNTFIYKFFEGYVFLGHFSFLRRSEIKKARQSKNIQKSLQNKIERLEERTSDRAKQKRNNLIAVREDMLANYDLEFPPYEEQIMPTRFGNILKAAEYYSKTRYGIDSVPIWPRLVHVIPTSYFMKVDQVNNQLSFLMNCALLTLLFSFFSLLVAIYNFFNPMVSGIINSSLPTIYLLLFVGTFILSLIFIKASVLVVVEYGYLIRASFDLFRQDLLKQFHLEVPEKLSDEKSLWEDVCDFINVGDKNGAIDFKFQPVRPYDAVVQHRNNSYNDDN